jgi:hypothetical protein
VMKRISPNSFVSEILSGHHDDENSVCYHIIIIVIVIIYFCSYVLSVINFRK